ncbi:ADP-ribose 1' [Alternaria sp. MG1]|nr:ADP-ribose 1' [Alternaria sp. MG1]
MCLILSSTPSPAFYSFNSVSGSQTSTAAFQSSLTTILSSTSTVRSHSTPNFPLLILHILTLSISPTIFASSSNISIAGLVFLTITSGLSLPFPYFALVNRQPIQCWCPASTGGIKRAVPVGTGRDFKRCSFVQKA